MKYEIVMRYSGSPQATTVTPSFGDAYMYGDLDYVRRCLVQCLFRVHRNGYEIVEHIYRDCNSHVMLWGFHVKGGQSYCIRKAVKQAKFNVKSQ